MLLSGGGGGGGVAALCSIVNRNLTFCLASPQVSIRGGSIVLEDPNMFSAGTFYCTIFAIPSANVSWFFFNSSANETTPLINGSDISIMRHYTSNLEVMETLSISRVGLAYRGGMVRCRASNVHGMAMAGTIPLIAGMHKV